MEIFLGGSQQPKYDTFERESLVKLRKSKDAARQLSDIHIRIIEQQESDLGDILDPEEELKEEEISEGIGNDDTSQRCHCSKILVVDDEPFNIIALEGLFQQFGVEKVDRAFNGREAIRLIEKNAKEPPCGLKAVEDNLIPRKSLNQHECYRLVMLDNNMPIMTGLEAAVNLRQMHDRKHADLSNTKLILITGDEVRGSRVDSDFKAIIGKVFDDILSKPLTRLEFEAFIKRNHTMFSNI